MFDDGFPIELILFLIAAIIGVVKRVVDAGKKIREKSTALEERQQQETHVRFEDHEAPRHVEQRAPEPQPAPPKHDPLMPPYGDPVDTALGREFAPAPVPVPAVPALPAQRLVPRWREPEREREEPPAPVIPAPRKPVVTLAARQALQRKLLGAKRGRNEKRDRRDRIHSLLRSSPQAVRDAILLREILAPPVALRGRRRF